MLLRLNIAYDSAHAIPISVITVSVNSTNVTAKLQPEILCYLFYSSMQATINARVNTCIYSLHRNKSD